MTVYCYYCGQEIETSSRTMSTPCPRCYKTVLVEDIVVKGYKGVTSFETCGRLIVKKKGHAVAKDRIVALSGIVVEGRVDCNHAITASETWLSKKSQWRGDLQSASLVVDEGARIVEGWFRVRVILGCAGPL